MIQILTLEEAKGQVRVTATQSDSDIQFKILQATAILLNYLKVPMNASVEDSPVTLPWVADDFGSETDDEVPWDIKAACALIFGSLYANREGENADPLSPAVRSLLARWRDPAMA